MEGSMLMHPVTLDRELTPAAAAIFLHRLHDVAFALYALVRDVENRAFVFASLPSQ